MRIYTLCLIVLYSIQFCSCNQSSNNGSRLNTGVQTQDTIPVIESNSAEGNTLITLDTIFKGNGKMTLVLYLGSGDATFQLKCKGNIRGNTAQNFMVDLRNADNSFSKSIVNILGDYEGSDLVYVPNTGIYIIEIDALGSWEINLNCKTDEPTLKSDYKKTAQLDTSLMGTGNRKIILDLKAGNFHIEYQVKGNYRDGVKQNYWIDILNSHESHSISVVNILGDYQGENYGFIPSDNKYVIEVEAVGSWKVRID